MNPPVAPGDAVRILELYGDTARARSYLGQTALVLDGPDNNGDIYVRATDGIGLYVTAWELP